MAGKPKFVEFCARIEREGGDDVILDRIAAGERITAIAASYGFKSPRVLYDWRNANDERKRAWMLAMADAKVEAAEQVLIDAKEKADNGGISSQSARISAEMANQYRWLASKLNRELYGDTPRVQVNNNLSIAELHLDALRKASQPKALPTEQPKVLEAEIVDEDAE